MDFSEIKPFCRYIRVLKLTENSSFGESVPLDCRLFYVKRGEGKIKIEKNTLTLKPGSILFINSFVPYTLKSSEVDYLAVNFDFTFSFSFLNTPIPPVTVKKMNEIKPIENVTFSSASCFKKYCFVENAFSFLPILEAAEKEFIEKPPYYMLKNSAQISEILIEICKKNQFGVTKENNFNAEKIAGYIKEHLSENIDNSSIAEHFHFHKNYLSSQFARCYGKPIHSYILEMRILKAVSLLESGIHSITEISESVGFKDANYFTRYFKKITGSTPKMYINKNRRS